MTFDKYFLKAVVYAILTVLICDLSDYFLKDYFSAYAFTIGILFVRIANYKREIDS